MDFYDSSDDSAFERLVNAFRQVENEQENIEKIHIAEKNIYKMQLEKCKLFELQDQEKGHFDVAFEFDGKLLYANKYVLVTASETLNSWLSDRWTKTDDPIKVETYTFDIFYQFCTFLYSGGCKLTTENIFQMIDAAEVFGIQLLKDYCDDFLVNNQQQIIKENNVFEMVEVAEKYSLPCFAKNVHDYLCKNYGRILSDIDFINLSKVNVLRFCDNKKDRCDNNGYNKRYDNRDYKSSEAAFFEALYKWTEHHAQIKKDESNKEFYLEEAIKNEFSVFLPYIDFSSIDIDLLMFYYTTKSFLFSSSEWLKYVSQADGSHEEIFKAVYHIAENFALKEEKKSDNANFDVSDSIKTHLAEYLPKVDFSQMSFTFMTEFVAERSFLYPLKTLLNGLLICRRSSSREEKMFQIMYELAKEEVLKKQKLNPVGNFNVNDAIKTELAELLPKIKFRQMNETFLLEFVVGNGILSHDEVFGSKIVRVKIRNEKNSLTGNFEDNLGIAEKVGKNSISNSSCKNLKQRFARFKFEIPEIPSELKKKDGIDWYLCLEWDGVLAAKNKALIMDTDFLICELESGSHNDSLIQKGGCTYLEVTRL